MNVIVAIYEHKYGTHIRAFDTLEKAEAWKEEIARENWDESDGEFDEIAYWASARGAWFTCEEVGVE